MNKKVILELRDDGSLCDSNGLCVMMTNGMDYEYFEHEEVNTKSTVELVKLGVSVDEIIKLKNMDLI